MPRHILYLKKHLPQKRFAKSFYSKTPQLKTDAVLCLLRQNSLKKIVRQCDRQVNITDILTFLPTSDRLPYLILFTAQSEKCQARNNEQGS